MSRNTAAQHRRASGIRQRRGLLLALAGAVLLAGLSGCGGKSAPPEFDEHIDTYLRETTDAHDKRTEVLKPKIIPIDVEKRRVDARVYYLLPDEWRATTPEEVNTIARLHWKESNISGGRTRYRCNVELINKDANYIVHSFPVLGDVPKVTRGVGSKPVQETADEIVKQANRFKSKD